MRKKGPLSRRHSQGNGTGASICMAGVESSRRAVLWQRCERREEREVDRDPAVGGGEGKSAWSNRDPEELHDRGKRDHSRSWVLCFPLV